MQPPPAHAYWTGTPLDRRRISHLARLELALATDPELTTRINIGANQQT